MKKKNSLTRPILKVTLPLIVTSSSVGIEQELESFFQKSESSNLESNAIDVPKVFTGNNTTT